MKKITLEALQLVKTMDDLEGLNIGEIINTVSERGGNVGLYSKDVAEKFGVDPNYLPPYYGAGCNYLGGGVRGAIYVSGYGKEISEDKKPLLNELAEACVRVYQFTEDDMKMNDEEDDDGDTNWEAKATNAARAHGTKSAY